MGFMRSFGQVFLEAMSCGLPVITTATGGPKDFINVSGEKETGWLVNPDDANSLAAAMVEAVENTPLRESRGHNARLFVEREYSWVRISDRVVEAYESASPIDD